MCIILTFTSREKARRKRESGITKWIFQIFQQEHRYFYDRFPFVKVCINWLYWLLTRFIYISTARKSMRLCDSEKWYKLNCLWLQSVTASVRTDGKWEDEKTIGQCTWSRHSIQEPGDWALTIWSKQRILMIFPRHLFYWLIINSKVLSLSLSLCFEESRLLVQIQVLPFISVSFTLLLESWKLERFHADAAPLPIWALD